MSRIVSIESIASAILTLLTPLTTNGAGFVNVSRKFRTPDQITMEDTPSLYLLQGPMNFIRQGGKPPMTSITFWLFIYTRSTTEDVLASTTLNNAISSVLDIMAPPNGGFPLAEQNLGGLVSNCWIEGDVIYDSGEIQPPGLCVLPCKVLVPALSI